MIKKTMREKPKTIPILPFSSLEKKLIPEAFVTCVLQLVETSLCGTRNSHLKTACFKLSVSRLSTSILKLTYPPQPLAVQTPPEGLSSQLPSYHPDSGQGPPREKLPKPPSSPGPVPSPPQEAAFCLSEAAVEWGPSGVQMLTHPALP